MRDIDDLYSNLKDAIKEFLNKRKALSLNISNVVIDMIQQRTIKGVDSSGRLYPPYSIKPIPRKNWVDLPSNQGESAKFNTAERLAEKKGGLFSYYDWREENLGQARRRDFRFTGKMMGSLKAGFKRGADVATISVSDQNIEKFRRNQEILDRKGGQKIMEISKSEENLISEIYGDDVFKIFKKKL
jgi:hypothetical protein